MKDNGVRKAASKQKITITVDRTNEQVLVFNQDKDIELVWVEDSFRELPEEVERQLRHDNLKRYLIVQTLVSEKAKRAVSEPKIESMIDPLGMNSDFRLRIRSRRGWHQCWKTPGNEFDAAMQGPYKQVRKQAEMKGKDGKAVLDKWGQPKLEEKEAGEENGEVLKLIGEDGKVELIATECPQELFGKHVEWMAEKSRAMYDSNKDKFRESVETLNVNLEKSKRMKVIDDSQN
jgi:hypothetical protein